MRLCSVCLPQRKGEGRDDVGAGHAGGSRNSVGVRRVRGIKVRDKYVLRM